MSSIRVAGSVVSSIAPRLDLECQIRRIVADHLTRFAGVPVAVYVLQPGDLAAVTVDGHTIPVRAGWPDDHEARRWAWMQDHSVAVVYPPFGEQL